MPQKIDRQPLNELYKAVLTLKTPDECDRFFQDLCTITELKAIAGRLSVARRLRLNQPYNQIVAETGVSTATISRVNRSLLYGNDGYSLVFDRLDQAE